MTDEDLDTLSKFINLPEDERAKHLKKKSREYLSNLALLCAAQAVRESKDKEEYGAQYERASRELLEYNEEHARHLEMSDKLADEVNRLRNERTELIKFVDAAIQSRNLHVVASTAALAAASADKRLAELGAEFKDAD